MNKSLLSGGLLCTIAVPSLVLGCNNELMKGVENDLQIGPNLVSTEQSAPVGYQWVMIENMSDEFSSSALDTSKWRDHITTWKGRTPADFLPENVSVKNGTLASKTSTHPSPNDKYNMAGTSVSGKYAATYGFLKQKLKHSK